MRVSALHQQIISELRNLADPNQAKGDQYYHKTKDYKSYGIKMPQVRRVVKKYRNEVRMLDWEDKKALAEKLYQSGYSEEAIIANAVLAKGLDDFKEDNLSFLDEITGHLNNWGTTDDFCSKILQLVLFKYPDKAIKLLERWNQSDCLWKKRASVVAFTRKVGESGKFTETVVDFCENLIEDDEDLIQKAVGWALKDNLRAPQAHEQVLEYIKDLRRRGVPSTITLYAIRDLESQEREEVLKIK